MPDDQVTIDPEFQLPPPGDGQSRWLRVAGIVAVGVAAFIFGWLLRSPSPAESEPDEVAVTSSTELTGETVAASTTTRPRSTTTTTEPPEMVGLEVPLAEVVPGFTDTIGMTHWDEERIDVLRWRASQPTPEVTFSFDQGEDTGWFAGLDTSGRWAAQVTYSGLLTLHPVPESIDERWPEEFDRAVDVRVASAMWHDSDPGRLAWVKCSRSVEDTDAGPRRVATLYSFDVAATDPVEPVAEFTIDGGCVAGWFVSPHLGSWGDEGVRYWTEGEGPNEVLIRPDGTKVELPPDSETFVAPDGSAVVIEHDFEYDRPGESYLLSSDGTTRSPVPGLAEDEWLAGVLWSPDGSLLAYRSWRGEEGDPVIRIVEMDTGSVVAEAMTPDWESWPVTWSTDSRFLLLEQMPSQGMVDAKELAFYDTETGSTVAIPMPIEIGDFRTVEPVPVTEMFTPVEWGFALDGAGPGVHLVDMIVDVGPVTPDRVEHVSGTLVWDETVVDLCRIEIREVGAGFVHIGNIFGTGEGCRANPTPMQDAFDEYGLPETACLAARVDGVDHEYCAPLN